jgi:hypothetical protein
VMVFNSLVFSDGSMSYVLTLFRKYLGAAILCWCGWHEFLGMITSVVVGFL